MTQSPFEDSMKTDLWGNTISKWGCQKGILFSSISLNNGRAYQAILVSMSSAPSKPPRAKRESMQCGSMSSQCQLILLGCRRMLQMPSAPLPCTKIKLDHMAPFMRCNWASMNTTRLGYTLKGYTILERLAVLMNLTFSAQPNARREALPWMWRPV